jgi:hypothetical protein
VIPGFGIVAGGVATQLLPCRGPAKPVSLDREAPNTDVQRDPEAWLAAWREGMRRRGYPKAHIIVWRGSYCYSGHQWPDMRCDDSCSDDADAVFLSIENPRPSSVRPRLSLRKLLAQSL